MNYSRECKKAISRNNAFEGNLQKDLENIEGQKKRIMRSLREKKLNFMERKSTLPKICLSSLEGKEPKIPAIRRYLSLDNAELSKLCEISLLTKKKLSTPNATTYFETQSLLQERPGEEKTKSSSWTAKSTDASTVLSHSPRLTRRSRSVGLHGETKPVLGRQLSLPLKNSASEIPVWLEDMHEENSKGGLFKTSMQVQSPFATLGTQLPTSPLLQTQQQQYSMKFLSPLNISGQQQSVSLPCSPRTNRRRAETFPQDTELSQEGRETFAEHLRTSQKLRSVSLGCAEIIEEGKEVSCLIKCLKQVICTQA